MTATAVGAALLAVALAGCGARSASQTTTVSPRAAPAFTAATVSSNWAGYVARRAKGGPFDAAHARWTMPRVPCSAGTGSSVAFWVGIGGYGGSSSTLEQLGASADCSPGGAVSYRTWTEVVPAAPTFLRQSVAAGDVVDVSVSVSSRKVSFVLQNVTRGSRFATTVTSKSPLDRSTAEWVAEAPSICRTIDECEVVPLSHFGSVAFTRVSATAGGVTGPLGVPGWRITPVALVTSSGASRYIASSNPYGAVPGRVAAGGGSFSIAFRSSFPGTVPTRPLPGAPLPAWVR